jgi:hypothetical protein
MRFDAGWRIRAQLSEKLHSLEEQVSGTVQSTGAAVSETAAAVKETVDAITDAVQGAVKSLGDTFDFEEHIKHHPWLLVGGAVAFGYLARELSKRTDTETAVGVDRTCPSASDIADRDDEVVERRQRTPEPPPSYLGLLTAPLMQAAATSLTESLRQAAAQAGPMIAQYFAEHEPRSSAAKSNGTTH